MTKKQGGIFHSVDLSAALTVVGIVILFSSAILVTLIAPNYTDPSWVLPSSPYQRQMYEISDPNVYISSSSNNSHELQVVYHIKNGFTLLAFQESETVRIVAPKELEQNITRFGDKTLKLTSELLLLRRPDGKNKLSNFDGKAAADKMTAELQDKWKKEHADNKTAVMPRFVVLELFKPDADSAFALTSTEGSLENWVDQNFTLLSGSKKQEYHKEQGVIFVNNPVEYRITRYKFGDEEGWRYDPDGEAIQTLSQLKNHELGFLSRKELIDLGEHIYAIEGCWYCHTDQTRTLVQDLVLNGSESYPAPPSSPNEYIYQSITFPGTKRNGPDLSRVGVKRPNRDWHKAHFWSPRSESPGSIMPSFQHFFDDDPRGTSPSQVGVPNYKFEAVFQYLMTKGTRITPPTEAWWLGKDPVDTIAIIEGRKTLP